MSTILMGCYTGTTCNRLIKKSIESTKSLFRIATNIVGTRDIVHVTQPDMLESYLPKLTLTDHLLKVWYCTMIFLVNYSVLCVIKKSAFRNTGRQSTYHNCTIKTCWPTFGDIHASTVFVWNSLINLIFRRIFILFQPTHISTCACTLMHSYIGYKPMESAENTW